MLSEIKGLGRILISEEAEETLVRGDIVIALAKHGSGEWGDVCEEQKRANDIAREKGIGPMSSAWLDDKRTPFEIVTDADRQSTKVQLLKTS